MKTSKAEFEAWMAKYEPVERAILKARERRIVNRQKREDARHRALGDLCEATEGRAKRWARWGAPFEMMFSAVKNDPWTLQCFMRYVRNSATRRVKCLSDKARRPLYYERENARRRELAAIRRKVVKRHTANPCPTREEILGAWQHRRDSHDAAVRFGSIIMDLECYLDNTLIFTEDGAICGRRGGIKRWLQEEIPALYLRYTTVMRFKAMAKKLRQIVELTDPVPAAAVLNDRVKEDNLTPADAGSGPKRDYDAEKCFERRSGNGKPLAECCRGSLVKDCRLVNKCMNYELPILRARAIWEEIVAGVGSSPTALMVRIDALLDPENVEEANVLAHWRRMYANEITLRRKFTRGL